VRAGHGNKGLAGPDNDKRKPSGARLRGPERRPLPRRFLVWDPVSLVPVRLHRPSSIVSTCLDAFKGGKLQYIVRTRDKNRGGQFARQRVAIMGLALFAAGVSVMIEKLKSVLAVGGAHLGDLLWWTLSDAAIDRPDLEVHWAAAGLATELLPEAPTAEKALKTAVREAALGQHDRLIRLGKESETEIVFAVVRETKHADGSVTYSQETRIMLDRKVETVSSDQPGHDLATVVAHRFGELRTTHTADDVRRTVVRAIGTFAAVALREHGGVYWIPSPYAKQLRQLQLAVEKIGSSKMYLLPVHDSADAGRTLGDAALGAIQQELGQLKDEVQGFVAQPPERPSTLARRFDAYEALRGRAQLYRDILKVQVQDLDQQLNEMTASVEKLLQEKQAA
jgi:hypothetical protein